LLLKNGLRALRTPLTGVTAFPVTNTPQPRRGGMLVAQGRAKRRPGYAKHK
jgi:hypothetical protein